MKMITRSEYIHGSATYDEYYSQFVNEDTVKQVVREVGAEDILAALNGGDTHLNTIPLKFWDALAFINHGTRTNSGPFKARLLFNRHMVIPSGESVTRAFLVCVAKQAAKVYASNPSSY